MSILPGNKVARAVWALALLLLPGLPGPVNGAPYDTWICRMKVRFATPIQGTLTNFPALVVLSPTNVAGFQYQDFAFPTSGADLRFADSTEATPLNYEIDLWNTNGDSCVWVQVPSIAGTNDFIYAYWGRTGVAPPPCTTNGTTWSNRYAAVWHLRENQDGTGTAGLYKDSTASTNHGTDGVSDTGKAGRIGAGQRFDGTDDYIAPAQLSGSAHDNYTMSFWVLPSASHEIDNQDYGTAGVNNQKYAVWPEHGGDTMGGSGVSAGNNGVSVYEHGSGYMPALLVWSGTLSDWTHVVVVYQSRQPSLYINGRYIKTGLVSQRGTTFPGTRMGGDVYGYLAGSMDEYRISSVARGSNWIWASWLNQASNGTFLAYSDAGPVATGLMVVAREATGIGVTNATMNGVVMHTGEAANPRVYVCWDFADHGTTVTSAWPHVVYLGTNWGKGQSFGTNITSLLLGSNYAYRCYVTNSSGSDWSDHAVTFQTIRFAAVTNTGAISVGLNSATLRGQILSTGGNTPVARFRYWTGTGPTTTVSRGLQAGAFSAPVTGLQTGVIYTYRCSASNMAGVTWSGDKTFFTEAKTYTWTGLASSDWFNENNWSPTGTPAIGDSAMIPSAARSAVLAASTPALASLRVAGGTLTCSNWSTVINATTVSVYSSGVITLPAAFAAGAMSNRVYVVCSNFTVAGGSWIKADERGYGVNSGPGRGFGSDLVGGSGHGGQGGCAQGSANTPNVSGGYTYGVAEAPVAPGSSSPLCYTGDRSGKGGGVIRIVATNVTVNGTISADAGHATESHAGGGAGGSIYITCQSFQGNADGRISARGGNAGTGGSNWNGGGGGGGRIAVIYQTCNLPSVTFDVSAGFTYFGDGGDMYGAEMGTICLSTPDILTPLVTTVNGRLIIPGTTSWSPTSLMVSNCIFGLHNNFRLNIGGNLVLTGATARLHMGTNCQLACTGALEMETGRIQMETGSTVTCGVATIRNGQLVLRGSLTSLGNFTLTNGASFHLYSGPTNGLPVNYGSTVLVSNDLYIVGSSWVHPHSHATDGGSPLFRMKNLFIATNSGFHAVGDGYGIGSGPGSLPPMDKASGASHAGKGGKGSDNVPTAGTYGSSNAPVSAGSGSGNCYYGQFATGRGGGVVRLEVARRMAMNGVIDASGATATGAHGAGGAGGSVFVIARFFTGAATAAFYAKGGNGGVTNNSLGWGGGAGGGGRVALWAGCTVEEAYDCINRGQGVPDPFTDFPGATSATNGLGFYNGPPNGATSGTLRLLKLTRKATILVIQ